MIDEEKANEYADECFKGNDKDSQYYRTILIKGYLDGLAEGRIETTEKISVVEKENAKLVGKIDRLEKQIEKMKNCRNCEHDFDWEDNDYCVGCISLINGNRSKWEMRKW